MPSGTPKKKSRRGDKGKVKVHAIVSSALVPPSVTKWLQETHHRAAPVAAPISAHIMASTVVGGPSHAPVQVPTTITSFKPSGVTYTKQEVPKNVQVFSGFTGQEEWGNLLWHGKAQPPQNLQCPWRLEWPVPPLSRMQWQAQVVRLLIYPRLHFWSAFKLLHQPTMLSMLLTKKPGKGRPIQALKRLKRTLYTWHHLILPLRGKMWRWSSSMKICQKNKLWISTLIFTVTYIVVMIDESLTQDPSGEHLSKMFDPYLNAPSDGEQDLSSEDEEKGCSPWLFTPPWDKDIIMEHWDDKGTPMHAKITVIKGMFLPLTLMQLLTANSC